MTAPRTCIRCCGCGIRIPSYSRKRVGPEKYQIDAELQKISPIPCFFKEGELSLNKNSQHLQNKILTCSILPFEKEGQGDLNLSPLRVSGRGGELLLPENPHQLSVRRGDQSRIPLLFSHPFGGGFRQSVRAHRQRRGIHDLLYGECAVALP